MRTLHHVLTAAVIGTALTVSPLDAQSLRGSMSSVDRMYAQAQASDLSFYRTAGVLQAAVAVGELVPLASNDDYVLQRVRYPYVLPSTRQWVQGFAARYRAACGDKLVITSGSRPLERQPRNSSPKSVHPTGMAVDLRKPRGRCLKWLRTELLSAERNGDIEATEERRPAHFHVAVVPGRIMQPVRIADDVAEAESEPETRDEAMRSAGVSDSPSAEPVVEAPRPASQTRAAEYERYRVRKGDTLWEIARRKDTTVNHLRAINHLRSSRIIPGQTLLVPADE